MGNTLKINDISNCNILIGDESVCGERFSIENYITPNRYIVEINVETYKHPHQGYKANLRFRGKPIKRYHNKQIKADEKWVKREVTFSGGKSNLEKKIRSFINYYYSNYAHI